VKQNKSLFILYIIFILTIPLQDIGLPHLFGKLTKTFQSGGDISKPLIYIIAIIFVLQMGYSIADYVDTYMFPAIQKLVRETLMRHLFEIQKSNYEELKIGEITTRLIKLPPLMYSFMDHWKNLYIPQIVVFTVAIIYFLIHDKIIGISLFILMTSLALMIRSSIGHCEELAKKRDHVHNALYEEVDDILRNSMTVLNYNQEEYELERIDEFHKEYTQLSKDALKCALRVRYTFLPIILTYLTFFTYYMYKKFVSKTIDLGMFISLFFIMIYLTNSMWRIIGNVKEIIIKWGMIQESLEIFNTCLPRYSNKSVTEPPYRQGIVMKNISYYYQDEMGNKRYIFDNLNIDIKQQEKVLIVGQIGSGKSTLLKLIMKYISPSEGHIFINNIPYDIVPANELRRFIGYIPQNAILFNRSIYENIVYGLNNVSQKKVEDIIVNLGLSDIFSKLPQGLNTNVGKYGSRLSGGQRQIVWIIRTILQDPVLVLMDEPTSAIDEETRSIVQKLLEVLMAEKTVIMVTHDTFLMNDADRIIEMKHGEVIRDETIKKSKS
jgi:ATP-binding cassette subfamily B protein